MTTTIKMFTASKSRSGKVYYKTDTIHDGSIEIREEEVILSHPRWRNANMHYTPMGFKLTTQQWHYSSGTIR